MGYTPSWHLSLPPILAQLPPPCNPFARPNTARCQFSLVLSSVESYALREHTAWGKTITGGNYMGGAAGQIDPAGWTRMVSFMKDTRLVKSDPKPEEMYTTKFLA